MTFGFIRLLVRAFSSKYRSAPDFGSSDGKAQITAGTEGVGDHARGWVMACEFTQ